MQTPVSGGTLEQKPSTIHQTLNSAQPSWDMHFETKNILASERDSLNKVVLNAF